MATTKPKRNTRRAGEQWTFSDHVVLIEAVKAGLTLPDIAKRVARTETAIRSRVRLMAPPDNPNAWKTHPLDSLRTTLREDPGYEWEQALRANLEAKGTTYWSLEADTAVLQAWDRNNPTTAPAAPEDGDETATEPMQALSETLGIPDSAIARRLIGLGKATSLLEVTDRLGAVPGSPLEHRVAWEKDTTSLRIWVLLAETATGTEVSVHPTKEAAEQAVEEAWDATSWRIVGRITGAGPTGPEVLSQAANTQ